jgi:hypothetical protein
VTLTLVAAISAISLAIRFPNESHPLGLDSFVLSGLSSSLTTQGYAQWVLNPLSYFGMYPLSYPSGGIFLMSAVTMEAGVGAEASQLLTSEIIALVGLLGAFLMGHELVRDSQFALMVAALYSFAPRFLLLTIWETPSRSGFMAIVPIVIWAMLRFHKKHDIIHLNIFLLALVILATFHRLAVLVIALLAAFLLSYVFLIVFLIVRGQAARLLLSPSHVRTRQALLLALLTLLGTGLLVGTGVLDQYSSGRLASGESVSTELLNLGISLGRTVGLILPLGFVGILFYATKRAKTMNDFFVLGVVIAFIPLLYLRTYTGFYAAAVLVPVGAGGTLFLTRLVPRKALKVALVATVAVVSIIGSRVIVAGDIAPYGAMSDSEYSFGLYMNTHAQTVSFNDGVLGSRVAAVSQRPYLPIGGASTVFTGPELLTFALLDLNRTIIVPVPIWELDVSSDSPFTVVNVNAAQDWANLMSQPLGTSMSNAIRHAYRVDALAENKALEGTFVSFGHPYNSLALASAYDSSYKVFEDTEVRLWFIGSSTG